MQKYIFLIYLVKGHRGQFFYLKKQMRYNIYHPHGIYQKINAGFLHLSLIIKMIHFLTLTKSKG